MINRVPTFDEWLNIADSIETKAQSQNHVKFSQKTNTDNDPLKTIEKNDFRKPLLLISAILVMIIMNINSYSLITKCSIALSCLVLIGAAQFYTKQNKSLNSNTRMKNQNIETTLVQEIHNNYYQTPSDGYSTPPRKTTVEI